MPSSHLEFRGIITPGIIREGVEELGPELSPTWKSRHTGTDPASLRQRGWRCQTQGPNLELSSFLSQAEAQVCLATGERGETSGFLLQDRAPACCRSAFREGCASGAKSWPCGAGPVPLAGAGFWPQRVSPWLHIWAGVIQGEPEAFVLLLEHSSERLLCFRAWVLHRGAPGKRARLLKTGRAGILGAAQPHLEHGDRTGPTSAPPGRHPHPASTPHGSHLPPACPSQHPSPGTCSPEPPPSRLSCTDPTRASVRGLSSPCPSPGPPSVPSQDAARTPWGTENILLMRLKQPCQCKQPPAPVASGSWPWHWVCQGRLPALGHRQGELDPWSPWPGAEQGLQSWSLLLPSEIRRKRGLMPLVLSLGVLSFSVSAWQNVGLRATPG